MAKAIERVTRVSGDQVTDDIDLRAILENPQCARVPTLAISGHREIEPSSFRTRFPLQPA